MEKKLVHYEPGSYFGDISFLFNIPNNFRYECTYRSVDENNKT